MDEHHQEDETSVLSPVVENPELIPLREEKGEDETNVLSPVPNRQASRDQRKDPEEG